MKKLSIILLCSILVGCTKESEIKPADHYIIDHKGDYIKDEIKQSTLNYYSNETTDPEIERLKKDVEKLKIKEAIRDGTAKYYVSLKFFNKDVSPYESEEASIPVSKEFYDAVSVGYEFKIQTPVYSLNDNRHITTSFENQLSSINISSAKVISKTATP